MPRLSLYRPNKTNDYRFLDRTISEMLTAGATDLYIHKYLGPTNQGESVDATQPQYDKLDPTNIQDLLFLENRDRTYDPNVYRLRGHYNVQNLDFDLSQFGLFLNNDIIFITVHYNDMIEIMGRKLMVGDVIELPHLVDYNPLRDTIPVGLKRFMQITDANYASEGFSQTWFPHLWRIKCEPLVDSQEFSQILSEPINQDNYLGLWDREKTYPEGYIITFGDKNYISLQEVPIGITPPNSDYWELAPEENLKDILGTYNKNIQINDAALEEAARILPKSGYDRSQLYIVPTYGEYETNTQLSGKYNQPAPPINIVTNSSGAPIVTGTVAFMRNPKYKNASPVLRIPKKALDTLYQLAVGSQLLNAFDSISLESVQLPAVRTSTGSGPVQGDRALSVYSMGAITGPYGTSDNTYALADANLEAPGFTGTVSQQMDWRADADPSFQYIARSSPRTFGYSTGYLDGDGTAPNGFPTGAGINFPQNPQVGDYFLRIDYFPQLLFRWDGKIWVRISSNIRTQTGFSETDTSQQSGFINNSNMTELTDGSYVPQKQGLSSILTLAPDPLPPVI